MSLSGRLSRLEKDNAPPQAQPEYRVVWGEGSGDDVKDAIVRAFEARDPNITQIYWDAVAKFEAPDIEPATRLAYAEDILDELGIDDAAPEAVMNFIWPESILPNHGAGMTDAEKIAYAEDIIAQADED
jgi:hypothetical protein